MANEIEGVLENIAEAGEADALTQAFATVDRMNREGRIRELVQLSEAIENAKGAHGALTLPHETVADHIEEVLALTPCNLRVAALFSLFANDRVRSVVKPLSRSQRARTLASQLAYGQPKDALLAALQRAEETQVEVPHYEVLACWLHELLLRGAVLDQAPEAKSFHAALSSQGHPLGSLPLALLEAEQEAPTYMPMYGTTAIADAVQCLANGSASMRTLPPPEGQAPPRATRLDDTLVEQRLIEAVRPWLKAAGSNGKSEAKVFRLDPPLANGAAGRWLLQALPLTCVESVDGLRAERCEAEAVWGALFAAAANGGAYSSGLGGAYGRRAAWTSLGALVDASADASPSAINVRARASAFLMFGAAAGAWWNDVAWDIGALALREGGASVAVLAASDVD